MKHYATPFRHAARTWHTLALTVCMGLATLCAPAQSNKAATTAQQTQRMYRYRVTFTDKKHNNFTLQKPECFLSPQSLQRRQRYGLSVDEHDLPVSARYLKQIRNKGLRLCCTSKWNNSAVFETADTLLAAQLRQLPFVSEVRCVWRQPSKGFQAKSREERAEQLKLTSSKSTAHYEKADKRMAQLNLNPLHDKGLRGSGITIAVIDGGFYNADLLPGLTSVKVLGTRNFVRPEVSVYAEGDHGMNVLSCMAAHTPQELVGTAPEASYYLLVSEDSESEQLVEEDYWCAAIEYADSLGVDMVTSSLGYQAFDHTEMNYRYADLDGRTAAISRVASLGASRGIFVVTSAGNSGSGRWKKITMPADAPHVLTVGAVDSRGRNAFFSSLGDTSDGRVKPDVMALGVDVPVYGSQGNIEEVDGTSFACPIMCGATACLLQAFPTAKPDDIIHALQRSSSTADAPNNVFGYGIPDLLKAYQLLQEQAQ